MLNSNSHCCFCAEGQLIQCTECSSEITFVEDEQLWVSERLPVANDPQLGDNLFDCHRLQKSTQTLKNEADNHEPWVNEVLSNGQTLIDEGHESSDAFADKIQELKDAWAGLKRAIEARKGRLVEAEKAHTLITDYGEAESWMSEMELMAMTVSLFEGRVRLGV